MAQLHAIDGEIVGADLVNSIQHQMRPGLTAATRGKLLKGLPVKMIAG